MKMTRVQSNPTKSNSELVFKPNTLSYGIYKLYFKNTVTFNSNQQVYADITQYIEITPTGIQVIAFENGINEISFGYQQDIELNPGLYSVDYDLLAQLSNLSYNFYCRPINNFDFTQLSAGLNFDKMNMNPDGRLLLNPGNQSCILSKKKFLFKYTAIV
jgi:hypothetical protein